MISPETTSKLLAAKANERLYLPNSPETLSALATKTLVQLVGPTGSGKSSLMDAVEAHLDDFSVVGTGTTREPRKGDHPTRYHYIEHSDEALVELFTKIDNQEIIQYYVTPKPPHYVYWSELQDYKTTNNIGDYFSSVIESFSRYGFKQTLPISITREVEPWISAVNARFPVGHPDRLARLEEAVSSISWSLDQKDNNHAWMLIAEDHHSANVAQLHAIVEGSPGSYEHAKTVATQCLQSILLTISEERP